MMSFSPTRVRVQNKPTHLISLDKRLPASHKALANDVTELCLGIAVFV